MQTLSANETDALSRSERSAFRASFLTGPMSGLTTYPNALSRDRSRHARRLATKKERETRKRRKRLVTRLLRRPRARRRSRR